MDIQDLLNLKQTKPNHTEPILTKPNHTKPNENWTTLNQTKPNHTEPNENQTTTKQMKTKPHPTKSNQTKLECSTRKYKIGCSTFWAVHM